jgi:hypothetical protein
MAACFLAAITYFPLFKALTSAVNPALAQAVATAPVTVHGDDGECSFMFDVLGRTNLFSTSCDIPRSYLSNAGVTYDFVDAPAGTVAELRVGDQVLPSFRGSELPPAELATARAEWQTQAAAMLVAAGYPPKAETDQINIPLTLLILVSLMSLAAMVYGPMAALLVELFPARIRYTSMSLPYHIGTGWFGGFLPMTAFAIVAQTGNIYSGLWYPLGFAAMSFVIGIFLLPQTHKRDIR